MSFTMSIGDFIWSLFNERENVISLSTYALERIKKYGNVPIKDGVITDWVNHKKWLRECSNRNLREEHNKRVSMLYKLQPKPTTPGV